MPEVTEVREVETTFTDQGSITKETVTIDAPDEGLSMAETLADVLARLDIVEGRIDAMATEKKAPDGAPSTVVIAAPTVAPTPAETPTPATPAVADAPMTPPAAPEETPAATVEVTKPKQTAIDSKDVNPPKKKRKRPGLFF